MAEQVVPPGVQTLLQILVGNDWPEGNPSDLRGLATAWRDAARDLRTLDSSTRTGVRYVDEAVLGQTRVAFDAYADKLTRDGDGYLPTLASICDSLGEALDTMALEIETLRIEIIGFLVTLAIEIAIDIALAFFGTEALIPVQLAVTRIAIAVVIRKSVIRLAAYLAGSVLAQVGWAFFAQLVEIAQHHRGSIDPRDLRNAAISGAVGGAVGFGVGALGSLVGAGLASGAKKALGGRFPTTLFDGSPPVGPRDGATKFAANAPLAAGWGAAAGASEGAAEDQAMGNSGDTISGAENGAFSGLRHSGHAVLNPDNRFSLSPADYLDSGLNKMFDKSAAGGAPAGRAEEPHITTQPDGTSLASYSDGTRITTAPDGSRLTSWPDGTRKVTVPDGSELTTFRDGATAMTLSDGTTITTHADGTEVVVFPDGTRIVTGQHQSAPVFHTGPQSGS